MEKRFVSRGHLIDSGLLTQIFNLIVEEGAEYSITSFVIGINNDEQSSIEIAVTHDDGQVLDSLTAKLIRLGCYEKTAPEAVLKTASADRVVPDDFYSSTNHRTEVFVDGEWREVANQRMDAIVVILPEGQPVCRKLRDVKKGDRVVCGSESIRVFPPYRERQGSAFGFMSNEVSSERSMDVAVAQIAREIAEIRAQKGKIVVVAGPVVIHTGGSSAFSSLIRKGYVHGLLSGNALAVHDIESELFRTSLGIDTGNGKPTHEGHRNHMRAINKVYECGSIKQAVESGVLTGGVMYELEKAGVPYCLAGSIRDDGPLPETVTDMIEAQAGYAKIIEGASLVLMLSSMLHSIGTGNMLPSWVKTVCVDINPAVVTKLSDRGSSQTIGVVSDVGFFLRSLDQYLP